MGLGSIAKIEKMCEGGAYKWHIKEINTKLIIWRGVSFCTSLEKIRKNKLIKVCLSCQIRRLAKQQYNPRDLRPSPRVLGHRLFRKGTDSSS